MSRMVAFPYNKKKTIHIWLNLAKTHKNLSDEIKLQLFACNPKKYVCCKTTLHIVKEH